MTTPPGFAVRTRVRSDRVNDFERWLRDTVAALTARVPDAPELRYFREWSAAESQSDGVDFIVLVPGTGIATLDLEPLLVRAWGAERAQAALAEFETMLLGEQEAWTLEPITEV